MRNISVVVVQMLTVADDSTLRERERNGLCQQPVNNLYKPITTRTTETSEPSLQPLYLEKQSCMKMIRTCLLQHKQRARRKQVESFFAFFWISSLNNELPGHSLFNRSKTVSAYGSILPTFRNTDFARAKSSTKGRKMSRAAKEMR